MKGATTLTRAGLERLLRQLEEIEELTLPLGKQALNWRIAENGKPEYGGVYAFWWRGSADDLISSAGNSTLYFLGPKGVQVEVELAKLVTAADRTPLPLYVGKSARDIAYRVGRHIMAKTRRTVPVDDVRLPPSKDRKRKTTLNQLRDRLDRLFPGIEDTRVLLREKVALSYVALDGPEHVATRFYLEDLAIGRLLPAFNLDSER